MEIDAGLSRIEFLPLLGSTVLLEVSTVGVPAMSKFQLEHIPIGIHAAVAVQLYIYMTIKTTNLNYIPKQMCIPKHDRESVDLPFCVTICC